MNRELEFSYVDSAVLTQIKYKGKKKKALFLSPAFEDSILNTLWD